MFSFDDWKVRIDSPFYLEAVLTSILLRILAPRLSSIIIHQVFDLKDFPPIYWKKILWALRNEFSMQSNWILAVLYRRKKDPLQGWRASCCLPTSALTEILLRELQCGCLFREWSPGSPIWPCLDPNEGRPILCSNTASVHTQSPPRIADIMTGW